MMHPAAPPDIADFSIISSWVLHLCQSIDSAKKAGTPREVILSNIGKAWDLHSRSPFISRRQTWPRGYPGDFETIEYLIRQINQATPGTGEYWLEYLALNSPIAQQHRNKVVRQAREILSVCQAATPEHPARILIIAAGSSPDLQSIQPMIENCPAQFVLNDADENAMEFSLNKLDRIRDKITPVVGNVLAVQKKLAAHGPFDLVVAGGLFDYLDERQVTLLLRTIWSRLLKPDGRLFFTNISTFNPYRTWIEYLANWRLIERTQADIQHLVADACGSEARVQLLKDPTEITWLVAVDRTRCATSLY